MKLQSVIYSGPVTALYNGRDVILAGIGSFVHVYWEHGGRWSRSCIVDILQARNIHQIKPESKDSDRYIVTGEKCMRSIEYDQKTNSVKPLTDLMEFSDWIWDFTWIKDNSNQVCLALGHNFIVRFDLTTEEVMQTVYCKEKCILYCANFVSNKSDALILAAGTVFNQVVLWSPLDHTAHSGCEPVDVFHRLTGHQGVIFSIDYNQKIQKLCSASDDRSLRLYQVEFPNHRSDPNRDDWINMKSSLLHVLYGHQARVWDVKLLSNVILSVGEDSACCIWSYEGNVIQKFKGHKGKSIWSVAVANSEDKVVTGGGDHSIRQWSLHCGLEPPHLKSCIIDFKMESDDFPRNTMFLDFERILVITNKGNLLLHSSDTMDVTWLMSDSEFCSYTVMAVSRTKSFVTIGNIQGVIKVLHIGYTKEESYVHLSVAKKIYDGKVFNVHFIEDDVLITTGPDGIVNVWYITFLLGEIKLELLHVMELPSSRHRWITTACYVNEGSHIVCGDRTGSVFVYKLERPERISGLIQKFPKIHGKAGVTHVCCHGDVLYTCGRDGLYRQYNWDDDDDNKLFCQNNSRVYKGFDWLEQMVFTSDGDTLVYGFHTNMFVIWNINQNQKLLEIDCGGGHRTWDYITTEKSSRFVYIKARDVKVVEVALRSNQTVVKPSVHGREICDVKHLWSDQDDDGNPITLFMTCSEDTSLNVMAAKYINGIPHVSILHTTTGHISSVRCIAVSPTGKNCAAEGNVTSRLVISGGGRAQIRIWKVYVRNSDKTPEKFTDTEAVSKSEADVKLKRDSQYDLTDQQEDLQNHRSEVNHQLIAETKNCLMERKVTSLKQSTGVEELTTEYETGITGPDTTFPDIHDRAGLSTINDDVLNPYETEASKILKEQTMNHFRPRYCSKFETGYVCLGEIKLGKAARRVKKPWRYPVDNSDPETRILDLCLFSGKEISDTVIQTLFFFVAGCSDGFVRLFSFEENTRETNLISSSSFHDHCVLKTSYIIVQKCGTRTSTSESAYTCTSTSDSGHKQIDELSDEQKCWSHMHNRVIILSAATDGVVAFYDVTNLCLQYAYENDFMLRDIKCSYITKNKDNGTSCDTDEEMTPIWKVTLHQSGVNSLDCQYLSGNKFILLSGGDDNTLTMSYLSITKDSTSNKLTVEICKKGSCLNAHAAQITGVRWLGSDLVLSVSIDQRLCLWAIQETEDSIQISLKDCKFVNVADVSNMDVFTNSNERHILISGEGLQIFRINVEETRPLLEDSIMKHTKMYH